MTYDEYFNVSGIICDDCERKNICWQFPCMDGKCNYYQNREKTRINEAIAYLKSQGFKVTKEATS